MDVDLLRKALANYRPTSGVPEYLRLADAVAASGTPEAVAAGLAVQMFGKGLVVASEAVAKINAARATSSVDNIPLQRALDYVLAAGADRPLSDHAKEFWRNADPGS